MKWLLNSVVGFCIIIVGIAPLAYLSYRNHSHNWKPLVHSLDLKPGKLQSPEFMTDINGRYLVNLNFDQLSDLRKEQCMFGVAIGNPTCSGGQSVQFTWQIISRSGEVIKSGSYQPLSVSGSEVTFTEFQGKRGAYQYLVLQVTHDADVLKTAHPKLVVEVGPEYWESLADFSSYSVLWAKTVGLLGLLWVIGSIGLRLLRH